MARSNARSTARAKSADQTRIKSMTKEERIEVETGNCAVPGREVPQCRNTVGPQQDEVTKELELGD